MKSYTDMEQSRKLAEFLPLESADMHYSKDFDGSWFVNLAEYKSVKIPKYVGNIEEHLLPCWSLVSLLGIIRETIGYTIYGVLDVYMSCNIGDKPWKLETKVYDNEVDACYELIIRLHEMNLL